MHGRIRKLMTLACLGLIGLGSLLSGCSPREAEPVRPVTIQEGELDPEKWGRAYPIHYDMWKQTGDPTPPGKSRYKKGYDTDGKVYDKLSEFPFMALLFNGWGFGVAYNEPQGHLKMLTDQIEIDPSRVAAGGVCLTCKTPYAPKLEKEFGLDYYQKPYAEVLNKIPEEHRALGLACADCHNSSDMSLKFSREFTLGKALDELGVDRGKLTRRDMRSLVCAQCHVTYSIPKDENKKSVGVFFPWEGSQWGDISVENIIKKIRSNPAYGEWTQTVTGFRMPFIRHPEFELFSRGSIHWNAGASCADCHMPYTKAGAAKVSNHRVMSPLKNDMKACQQCHSEGADWLKEQVFNIQDRIVSQMIRAGYATATVAKLFETTHKQREKGVRIDQELYDQAKDFYMEAFLRQLFIGAENSVGFHNPIEASRILGDALAFAGKAEGFLRQALGKAGVDVPLSVDLELDKYLNNRGVTKLQFDPEVEIKDPFKIQQRLDSN